MTNQSPTNDSSATSVVFQPSPPLYQLPNVRVIDLVAVLVILFASILTFSKNLYIDNAVVFHDEYVYKVSSDRSMDASLVVERQLAPEVPNKLFLAVYGKASNFGSNYYAFAQLLNVVFWGIGLFCLYLLAVLLGLSRPQSLLYLAVATLLPFAAYTKYFMPEAMYFAMYALSLLVLIGGVSKGLKSLVFISGLLVGSMYFVKPHALALAVAVSLFLTLAMRGLLPKIVTNVLFGAGMLLAIASGRYLISSGGDSSSVGLGVYVQMLDSLVTRMKLYVGQPTELVGHLWKVALGHGLFLLSTYAISFLVATAVMFPRLGLLDKTTEASEGLLTISRYLLPVSLVLVGMAITFTVFAGEVGRVHSRYYSFLYPIMLLILFFVPTVRFTLAGKVFGMTAITGAGIAMASLAYSYSEILHIALVSDAPEWGFVFWNKTVFLIVVCASVALGIAAVLDTRRIGWLIALIGVSSLISGVDVATKQKSVFRGAFVTGREAVVVEEIVGLERLPDAVVVGDNRDVISKFLFNLRATPNIEQLALGSNLKRVAEKFPHASHIIIIADGYVIPPEFKCSTDIPKLRICTM